MVYLTREASKLWKKVCMETSVELQLLAEKWKFLLVGILFLYIHGLSARGVHYLHQPGPILKDLGFMILLELGAEKSYFSETLFTVIFFSFILIVYYIFNPSIVASNLSWTFTMESLSSTWFMPINILLTFIIGSAFGWILNKITKPPSHLRAILLGCCASGNLGIMLLIIIPSTCYEKESPFGAPAACHAQAMAYASFSMGHGFVFCQILCPFILDQFYWAERLYWLGVSPEPLERQHLIPDSNDPTTIRKAADTFFQVARLAKRMTSDRAQRIRPTVDYLLSMVRSGKLKYEMELVPFRDFNVALDKALGKHGSQPKQVIKF